MGPASGGPSPSQGRSPQYAQHNPPPQKVEGQWEQQQPQPNRAASGQPGAFDAVPQPADEAEGGSHPQERQGAGDGDGICLGVPVIKTIQTLGNCPIKYHTISICYIDGCAT